jgi:hypothetical protein
MVLLGITSSQFLLGSLFGGIIYLLGILLVALLMTVLFGDSPVLVVFAAIFWPGLLIPILMAAAGYRLGGGHKIEGRG